MHICILRVIIIIYIVKCFNRSYLVFNNADVFFYFQYIFEMGQVPREVNGGLILVV